MEPVSALIIAMAAAWAITRGAVDAAASQAAQEAHAAADAIRADLRGRSEAWAKTLADRISAGRAGGPSTAMWWMWAAARTGRAVRDGLRREPREQERARQIRDTTGPWRRIFDAGANGARFAREQAQRQRQSQERPTRAQLGVCEQCGAVVARQSLEALTVGPARRRLKVCVACRAAEADRNVKDTPRDPSQADAGSTETVDPDLVTDPPRQPSGRPELRAPRPELGAPAPTNPAGARPASPQPGPSPAPPNRPATPAAPSSPQVGAPRPTAPTSPSAPQPAVPSTGSTPQIEQGEPMAPRAPGQIVPRSGALPILRATSRGRGGGGESYTHGQWTRSVTDIEERLAALPAALEVMLHSLNSADAGRSQVKGVMALSDEIVMFMQQVKEMLAEVDRKERPMLRAVDAAGGPDEIAGIPYLREV